MLQRAIQNNRSISQLYILYQFFVIGFSLLGPAIIFTMLVFAQVAAFGVDSSRMLWYNATPVLFFILICFLTESSTQLFFARVDFCIFQGQ